MTKRPSVNDALKGSMPERIEGLPLRYGQEAFDLGGGLVEVRGRCYVTKEDWRVTVSRAGLVAWLMHRVMIQDALPDTPIEDREFLISGTSPRGWSRLLHGGDDA
jgi:hypothetical protein